MASDASVTGSRPYTAARGDSYDMLALQAYGEERLASLIAEANPRHLDVLLFEGGEALSIPLIDRAPSAADVPPWRR